MFFLLPALFLGGAVVVAAKAGNAAADAALGAAERCIKHPPIPLWGGRFSPSPEGRRAFNRLVRLALAAGADEAQVVGAVTLTAKYLASGGQPLDADSTAGAQMYAMFCANAQTGDDLLRLVREATAAGLRPL